MTPAQDMPRWGPERPVIWLTGFMGTGKTTVGQMLARLLQRQFVDTDALIEESAGCTVAELFARDGEAAFRVREQQAVCDAAAVRDAVVALGGGAFIDARNREAVRRAGPVLCLTAEPATIVSRLGHDALAARPLLAGPDPTAAIARLLAEREAAYSEADMRVATDGLDPEAIAIACMRGLEERQWLSLT